MEQSYEVAGIVFGIRANTDAAAEWLHYALAEYEVEDDITPFFSIHVGEDDGKPGKRFHILYEESREVVRTFDLAKVARALLSRVTAFQLGTREDAVYVEAGIVSIDGRNVLVPGDLVDWLASLHGRKLERAGVAITLESSFALDPPGLSVAPVPPTLSVPGDAVARFEAIAPSSDSDQRLTPDGPLRIDAIALNGLSEEVRQMRPGAVTFELAQRVRNLGMLGGEALTAVQRVAQAVPGYEIPAWNPQMMLDQLVSAFGGA